MVDVTEAADADAEAAATEADEGDALAATAAMTFPATTEPTSVAL